MSACGGMLGGSLLGLMEGYGSSSLCSVRGSLSWVQTSVELWALGFVIFYSTVFVCVLLGPGGQLSSLVFLPTPALHLPMFQKREG